MNGIESASVFVRPAASARAIARGRYERRSAASSTRCRVASFTRRFPEKTWETVVIETFAASATSKIVARVLVASGMRRNRTPDPGR